MANPIKASDLYKDDGAIEEAIREWKRFRDLYVNSIDTMKGRAILLKNSLKGLNGAVESHRRTMEKNVKSARDLKVKYDQLNRSLAASKKQISALESAQKKYNSSVANTAKVNRSLRGSFLNLTRSVKTFLGAYLGMTALAQGARNIFETTKKLDSLNIAFKKVTGTQADFARAQAFLKTVTENYGLELLSTSRSYMKFLAAVQTTNLGIQKSEEIFESFAKVNSILGLSADDSKGVFLALEQMISKGKVSTEELRLQMGERVPGAFQIMARAAGVSTSALAGMLKRGEVMSADVLPKFAEELEKAFGVENETRIDTLAGAQNRMTTAWVEFVEELDARGVFTNVLNFMRDFLKFAKENLNAIFLLGKAVTVATAALAAYRVTTALATSSIIAAGTAQKGFTIATRLSTIATAAFNAALRLNPIGIVVSLLTAGVAAFVLFKDSVEDATKEIDDIYAKVSEGAAETEGAILRLIRVAKDETVTLEERQKAIAELGKIAPEYLENLSIEETKLEDLLTASDKYNKSIKDRALSLAIENKIKEEQAEIDRLQADVRVKEASGVQTGQFGMTGLGTGLDVSEMKKEIEARTKNIEEYRSALERTDEVQKKVLGVDTGDAGDGKKKKDLGAIGSLKRLRAELAKLEEDLLKVAPGGEQGLIAKILKAKEAVEDAEQYIKSLKEVMAGLPDASPQIGGVTTPADLFGRTAENEDELIQARIDRETESFEIFQKFQASGFKLYKHTEDEKKKFALQQEKDKLEKMLELNERYGGDLTQLERLTIRNQIQAAEQEIAALKPKKSGFSIYKLMGIKPGSKEEEEAREALKSGFDFARDQITSFFKFQNQIANKRVQDADRVVNAAQRTLDTELRLAEQGLANKAELARKELEIAKQAQKKALKQRQRAARAEQAIQSIEQGYNLVTASAKILAKVPFPFNLAAVGLMFGAFAAAKIKAFQLTKEEFGGGGFEIIGGGTHASGNDTPLGFTKNGKQAYGERGEAHGIIRADMVRKYSNVLPELFESLNKGTFERTFTMQENALSNTPGIYTSQTNLTADMAGTEQQLAKLNKKGDNRTYIDGNGRQVVIRGNHKTTYV